VEKSSFGKKLGGLKSRTCGGNGKGFGIAFLKDTPYEKLIGRRGTLQIETKSPSELAKERRASGETKNHYK